MVWFGGREQRWGITEERRRSPRIIAERIGAMISVPFVSFAAKQLYALRTSNDIDSASNASHPPLAFRPSFLSYSCRVTYSRFLLLRLLLLVIFCHIFIIIIIIIFFSSSSSSPLYSRRMFFLLLTDWPIRQIARTNDEPPGDPFRTLHALLLRAFCFFYLGTLAISRFPRFDHFEMTCISL